MTTPTSREENVPNKAGVEPDPFVEKSLGHLHLQPETLKMIESFGFRLIGDTTTKSAELKLPDSVASELLHALRQLRSVTNGGTTDWLAYYALRNFHFHGLFFCSDEFRNIDSAHPAFSINRASFGNAGTMFERTGYNTFGSLLDGLRIGITDVPRGLGPKKLTDFWKRLLEIAEDMRHGGDLIRSLEKSFPIGGVSVSEDTAATALGYTFSESILKLDIGNLHLGTKTEVLRHHGINEVRDLLRYSESAMLSIPGLGSTTIDRTKKALRALSHAEQEFGQIDWVKFCDEMELTLLPAEPSTNWTIGESILRLPSVIVEMIRYETNPAITQIVTERLMKRPSERMTLEEIAVRQPKPLVRERIRQLEAQFLSKLAAALIEDEYSQSSYRFRPEFTEPWKKAARHFANLDREMSLERLVAGLEQCWDLPRAQFISLIPLVIAILTGELATLGDYRKTLLVDSRKLSNGASPALQLPIKWLQFGKLSARLETLGIRTLGHLVRGLETEVNITALQKKQAVEQIQSLIDAIDNDGRIDWRRYAQSVGVPFEPSCLFNNKSDFLDSIIPVSIRVIENRNLSAIASAVFTKRSSVSSSVRPTMEALAQELGKFGPSIKRVETEVLSFLNAVFVGQNISIARTQICPTYLATWAEVDGLFKESECDSKAFEDRLCASWQMPREKVTSFMPVLIAILSGYPLGRPGKYARLFSSFGTPTESSKGAADSEAIDESLLQKVILRGFRRTH